MRLRYAQWVFEDWVQRHMWVGRRRRIGISIWGRTDHKHYLPLAEFNDHTWWVRLPGTRWCLASYRRKR